MVVGRGYREGTQSRCRVAPCRKKSSCFQKGRKKNFFDHLCAQPRAKCSHCKGREPCGAPSPGDMKRESEMMGSETASARGHAWQS